MDKMSQKSRSKVMAAIKSNGNHSTERRLRAILASSGISGYQIRPKGLFGNPDFVFASQNIVIFVDGCFWHGCPQCYKRPSSSQKYWDAKVKRNRTRARKVNSELGAMGWKVIRFWEHELSYGWEVREVLHKLLVRANSSSEHPKVSLQIYKTNTDGLKIRRVAERQ